MGYYKGPTHLEFILTEEMWEGSPVYLLNGEKMAIVNGECLAVPSDYDIALEELDKEFPRRE